MPSPMSAIGPKRTSIVAPHMSAFGGKADMALLCFLRAVLFYLIKFFMFFDARHNVDIAAA
jgi:hypothetical protein